MTAFNKRFNKLNDKVNNELYYLGYSKIGNIGKENLTSLINDTNEIMPEIIAHNSNGKFFAMIDTSLSLFKKSHEIVEKNVLSKLEEFFDLEEVDVFAASHLVKPYGNKSMFAAHQDSAIVKEPENFSLNAWIPLTKVNRLNGCLWVLPGSHIFPHYLRHTYNKALNDLRIQKKIWRKMKPITFKAGDIFLFHRSLIHGSSKNYLPWEKYRIAVECLIVPKKAQFYVYYKNEANKKNEILIFEVDKNHFFENEDPRGKLLKEMKNYTVSEFESDKSIIDKLESYLDKFEERKNQLYK